MAWLPRSRPDPARVTAAAPSRTAVSRDVCHRDPAHRDLHRWHPALTCGAPSKRSPPPRRTDGAHRTGGCRRPPSPTGSRLVLPLRATARRRPALRVAPARSASAPCRRPGSRPGFRTMPEADPGFRGWAQGGHDTAAPGSSPMRRAAPLLGFSPLQGLTACTLLRISPKLPSRPWSGRAGRSRGLKVSIDAHRGV